MTDFATYSLWLEPSEDFASEFQERINELSQLHGTPAFSPHVTLVGGVTTSEKEAVSATKELASSLKPFELELTKADYLDRFYQSLFVHVAETDQLLNLRKKALHFFNISDAGEYMPHMSLLYGDLSQSRKGKILDRIGRDFHIPFTVKKMTLVKTDGKPDEWKRIHSAVFESAINKRS